MHGEGWVRRLGKAGGAVKRTLATSLDSLWNETLCWFGPNDDPIMQQLYQAGVIDALPDELRSRYLQKVMPTLQQMSFNVPATFNETKQRWDVNGVLPWEQWDNVGRRLSVRV